jgi:hypothetical protein
MIQAHRNASMCRPWVSFSCAAAAADVRVVCLESSPNMPTPLSPPIPKHLQTYTRGRFRVFTCCVAPPATRYGSDMSLPPLAQLGAAAPSENAEQRAGAPPPQRGAALADAAGSFSACARDQLNMQGPCAAPACDPHAAACGCCGACSPFSLHQSGLDPNRSSLESCSSSFQSSMCTEEACRISSGLCDGASGRCAARSSPRLTGGASSSALHCSSGSCSFSAGSGSGRPSTRRVRFTDTAAAPVAATAAGAVLAAAGAAPQHGAPAALLLPSAAGSLDAAGGSPTQRRRPPALAPLALRPADDTDADPDAALAAAAAVSSPPLRTQPAVAEIPQAVTRSYQSGRFAVQEGVLLIDPAQGAPGGSPSGGNSPAAAAADSFHILRTTSLPDSSSMGLQASLAGLGWAQAPHPAPRAPSAGAAVAAAASSSFFQQHAALHSSCGELPPLAEDEVCCGMDWERGGRSGAAAGASDSAGRAVSCSRSRGSGAGAAGGERGPAIDPRALRRAISQGGFELGGAAAAWAGRRGQTVVVQRGRFLVSDSPAPPAAL